MTGADDGTRTRDPHLGKSWEPSVRSVGSVQSVRSSVRSVRSVESAALRATLFNALGNGRTLRACSAHRERWSRLPPAGRVPGGGDRVRRAPTRFGIRLCGSSVPRLLETRVLTRPARALVSGGAGSDRDVVAAARRIDTPPRSPTRRTSSASGRAIWSWAEWRVAPGTTRRGSSGAIGAGVTAGSHVSLGVMPNVASMCSPQRAFSRWSPPMARHQAEASLAVWDRRHRDTRRPYRLVATPALAVPSLRGGMR